MASVTGINRLRAKLNRIDTRDLPKAYGSAMTAVTLEVKGNSQKRTPVDTGYLKSSAYSNLVKVNEYGVVGTVGYSANYAIYVHEHTWKKHQVGEAKFLENAVKHIISKVPEIFSFYIKKIGFR